MKRLLSSRATWFWKWGFPLLWSGLFGAITLTLLAGGVTFKTNGVPVAPATNEMLRWLFVGAWLLGSTVIWWLGALLKSVSIDENTLYVSNFRREVAVPLTEIVGARENQWVHVGNRNLIKIELRAACALGKTVTFVPTGVAPRNRFGTTKTHPIVAELQAIAARNAEQNSPFNSS